MVGVGDHYVDVAPDTLLSELNVHHSGYPPEQFQIDLDSDGVYDARFFTYGGGGLGGGAGGCQLQPEPWVSIIAHLDTSNGCCPGQYIALLADTLPMGHTISALDSFIQGQVYLWSESYGQASAPIINEWLGIGEHFIGVRMLAGIDTLYGWIRVNAYVQGARTLVIMDHAIEIGGRSASLPLIMNWDYGCSQSSRRPCHGAYSHRYRDQLGAYPRPALANRSLVAFHWISNDLGLERA